MCFIYIYYSIIYITSIHSICLNFKQYYPLQYNNKYIYSTGFFFYIFIQTYYPFTKYVHFSSFYLLNANKIFKV
jgi:hypothetical protein